MEQKKCLGLYISGQKAVAVVLSGHGHSYKVLACCSVEKDPGAEDQRPLAAAAADIISGKKIKYDEVSVAVDCSLFTQHDVHSEFTDHKQIANTIRFDAEEAVAVDAMELAIAFEVTASGEAGSNVTVYTSKRDAMTDMLKSMLQNGLDPTAMEPDIACLTRFIAKSDVVKLSPGQVIVVIGEKSCYVIIPSPKASNAPFVRSFLVSNTQDITGVLAREIPITIASNPEAQAITSVIVAGKTEGVVTEGLEEKTALEVTAIDLSQAAGADTSVCPDEISDTDFAIAYGAALSELSRTHKTDFRQDFMPFEGRKRIIQKTLRFISVAMTIVFIALGVYSQKDVMKLNSDANKLEEKLYVDQGLEIFSSRTPEQMSSRLKRELNKIKKGKTGLSVGDESSATARLTFLFEAINKTSVNNKLVISKITISPRMMQMQGSTKSKAFTNDLFKAIDSHPKLRKTQTASKTKGTEDTFTVTIELKQ